MRKIRTEGSMSAMISHPITCKHCGEEHIGRSIFSKAAAEESAYNKEYLCGKSRQQYGKSVEAEA